MDIETRDRKDGATKVRDSDSDTKFAINSDELRLAQMGECN
jgi:hypothetical protein